MSSESEFKTFIDAIRERADLIEVMSEDVIGLEQRGNCYRGASDWPSLIAWPNQTWRDFGGDRGGDVLSWLQEVRKLSFMDAANYLADRYGVDKPDSDPSDARRHVARVELGKVLEAAFIYYHNALPSKIREGVLHDHYGFGDEIIDRLMLGWAGPQVDHRGRHGRLYEYLIEQGFDEQQCLATGLFIRFKNGRIVDFFANRLVFPYWKHGIPSYAIGRRVEPYSDNTPHEQAKYKKLLTHSEKHPYVSEHIENSAFYNEDVAIRGRVDLLLATEGVTDCISAMQAGINCISPVTVRFRDKDTEKLIKLAKRAERFIICNDAEANASGEKGALTTASKLFAAGVDARLAALPKPEGVEKVDVNEFIKSNGGSAFLGILEGAKRLPDYLIERVSPATDPAEISTRLAPAIDLLCSMPAIEQTSYVSIIAKRFKVGKNDIKKLVKERTETIRKKARQEEKEKRERLKGEILEGGNFYYTHNMDGDMVVVSSFKIEPTDRVLIDGVQQIVGNIITDKNRVIPGVSLPPSAWQGRRQFLQCITKVSPDLQWTGSDDQVQGLLRIVADADVKERTASTMLGWYELPSGGVRWIAPKGIIGADGFTDADDLAYVSNGSPLASRVDYKIVDDEKVKQVALDVLPNLMNLNKPAVMLPLIGWYFAAPFRKPITDSIGHFPILWVWGTQGSGKTSLQLVFWRMQGVKDAEPFSATETEFSMLRLLSCTNGVPIVLDEYKPADMQQRNVNRLMRYVRRVYGGETESRGRPDLTLVNYQLAAPLAVTGESKPDHDPAVLERVLTASPSKNTIELGVEHHRAYAAVRRADVEALALPLVKFVMRAPYQQWIEFARAITNKFLSAADSEGNPLIVGSEELPGRAVDNLIVMVFGLIVFQEFAKSLGVELEDPDVEDALRGQCNEILDADGTSRDVFDSFIEDLSTYAQANKLRDGIHYAQVNGVLCLQLRGCYQVYLEQRKRAGLEDATNGLNALRRVIREKVERGGYVLRADHRVRFGDSLRRCVAVDPTLAPEGLDIDPFPVDKERTWGGGDRFDGDNEKE